jgi:hypothetical protein
MEFRDSVCDSMDWLHLVKYRIRRQVFLCTTLSEVEICKFCERWLGLFGSTDGNILFFTVHIP